MRDAANLVMPVLIAAMSSTRDLVAQFERRVDRGVAEAAAGIALRAEAALDDLVAAAEIGERLERDRDAAVEGAEIAAPDFRVRRRSR